jgi:hypothetical protein
MRTMAGAFMLPLVLSVGAACERKEAPPPAEASPPAQAPSATTEEQAPAPSSPQASPEPGAGPGAEISKAGEPGASQGAGEHAAAGEHGHGSPHGGQVATTSGGHIELLATQDGSFHVWLLDGNLGLRPVDGATATVSVGSASPVSLAPGAGHLTGKGPRIEADHAQASVKVTMAGKNEEATFNLDFEDHGGGKKHGGGHDH